MKTVFLESNSNTKKELLKELLVQSSYYVVTFLNDVAFLEKDEQIHNMIVDALELVLESDRVPVLVKMLQDKSYESLSLKIIQLLRKADQDLLLTYIFSKIVQSKDEKRKQLFHILELLTEQLQKESVLGCLFHSNRLIREYGMRIMLEDQSLWVPLVMDSLKQENDWKKRELLYDYLRKIRDEKLVVFHIAGLLATENTDQKIQAVTLLYEFGTSLIIPHLVNLLVLEEDEEVLSYLETVLLKIAYCHENGMVTSLARNLLQCEKWKRSPRIITLLNVIRLHASGLLVPSEEVKISSGILQGMPILAEAIKKQVVNLYMKFERKKSDDKSLLKVFTSFASRVFIKKVVEISQEDVFSYLVHALENSDSSIRKQAIDVLKKMKQPEAIALLANVLVKEKSRELWDLAFSIFKKNAGKEQMAFLVNVLYKRSEEYMVNSIIDYIVAYDKELAISYVLSGFYKDTIEKTLVEKIFQQVSKLANPRSYIVKLIVSEDAFLRQYASRIIKESFFAVGPLFPNILLEEEDWMVRLQYYSKLHILAHEAGVRDMLFEQFSPEYSLDYNRKVFLVLSEMVDSNSLPLLIDMYRNSTFHKELRLLYPEIKNTCLSVLCDDDTIMLRKFLEILLELDFSVEDRRVLESFWYLFLNDSLREQVLRHFFTKNSLIEENVHFTFFGDFKEKMKEVGLRLKKETFVEQTDELLENLRVQLRNSDSKVYTNAVVTLAKFNTEQARELLLYAMRLDEEVAKLAMSKLEEKNIQEILPFIKKMFKDKDPLLRKRALSMMFRLLGDDALPYVKKAKKDRSPIVREQAYIYLDLMKMGLSVMEYRKLAKNGETIDLWIRGLEGLVKNDPENAAEYLVIALNNFFPFVRKRAVELMYLLVMRNYLNREYLIECLEIQLQDDDPVVRKQVFVGLTRLAPEKACECLHAALKDPAPEVRLEATLLIGELKDKARFDFYSRILQKEYQPIICFHVLDILQTFGTKSELSVVANALTNSDYEVQRRGMGLFFHFIKEFSIAPEEFIPVFVKVAVYGSSSRVYDEVLRFITKHKSYAMKELVSYLHSDFQDLQMSAFAVLKQLVGEVEAEKMRDSVLKSKKTPKIDIIQSLLVHSAV